LDSAVPYECFPATTFELSVSDWWGPPRFAKAQWARIPADISSPAIGLPL
jgi:hypothetical protein